MCPKTRRYQHRIHDDWHINTTVEGHLPVGGAPRRSGPGRVGGCQILHRRWLTPEPLALPLPLPPADLDRAETGNRFDSALGNFSVLYFGSSLETCFGETLARFRPDVNLLALIEDEWRDMGFMSVGSVPADWRHLLFLRTRPVPVVKLPPADRH